MSARPRPVTATFPPTAYTDYNVLHSHTCSLSPGSSTASLVSVLDHDSCDDLSNCSPNRNLANDSEYTERTNCSDNERSLVHLSSAKRTNCEQQGHQVKCKNARQMSHSLGNANQQTSTSCSVNASGQTLSAYELWCLQKGKEKRDQIEKEIHQQMIQQQKLEQNRLDKMKKKADAEAKLRAWVEEYDSKQKQKLKVEKQRERTEKELKEDSKQMLQSKAAEKFKEWLDKKKAEDAELARLEKEKKEKEMQEKEDKRRKNEEAFRKWCQEAKNRPRTAPNSYGYSAGKLKGYYDASAYPEPSFVNPQPWHPIEIPQPKPAMKKKLPKQRWNAEKYL